MSLWYVKKPEPDDGIAGPLTTKQMKQLAADGRLQPDDLVIPNQPSGAWKQAAKYRGLVAHPDESRKGSDPPPMESIAATHSLNCTSCNRLVTLRSQFAGYKITCCHCGTELQASSAPLLAAAESPSLLTTHSPLSAPSTARNRPRAFLIGAAIFAGLAIIGILVASLRDLRRPGKVDATDSPSAAVEPPIATTSEPQSATETVNDSLPQKEAPPLDRQTMLEAETAAAVPRVPQKPLPERGKESIQERKPIEPVDLIQELATASYEIEDFTDSAAFKRDAQLASLRSLYLYGTSQDSAKVMSGSQFDRLDAEEKNKSRRAKLSSETLALRNLDIWVPEQNDFVERGLLVTTGVGLSLRHFGVRGVALDRSTNSFWGLSKDGKSVIDLWRHNDLLAAQKMGAVIYKAKSQTTLIRMRLHVDRDTAKQITDHKEQYRVTVVLSGLKYHRPYSWGLYWNDRLVEVDGDCDALEEWNAYGLAGPDATQWYFPVAPNNAGVSEILASDLRAVYFHRTSGEIIRSWFGKDPATGGDFSSEDFVNAVGPVSKSVAPSSLASDVRTRLLPGAKFTGKWSYGKSSGGITLEIIEYKAEKTEYGQDSLVAHLYRPSAASQTKRLTGKLIRTGERANPFVVELKADPKTGIRRTPSRTPNSDNLLREGDSREIKLTLDDDKLTGEDSVGVTFELSSTSE